MEREWVGPGTQIDYCRQLGSLDRFSAERNLQPLATESDTWALERCLLEFFDHLFLLGHPVGWATRLIAALALR